MNFLKNIILMAMVAFAAIAVTACEPNNGEGSGDDSNEVKEEQPSELYSEWLGDWVFKGDNGVSNNVTISQKTANREIYFSGLAELALASSTASVAPMRYSFSKGHLATKALHLTLGEKIESVRF